MITPSSAASDENGGGRGQEAVFSRPRGADSTRKAVAHKTQVSKRPWEEGG